MSVSTLLIYSLSIQMSSKKHSASQEEIVFKITCHVEDKNLGRVLAVLNGLVAHLEMPVQFGKATSSTISSTEVKKAAHPLKRYSRRKKGRKGNFSADSQSGKVAQALLRLYSIGDNITRDYLAAACDAAGVPATSIGPVSTDLVRGKILERIGQGKYVLKSQGRFIVK